MAFEFNTLFIVVLIIFAVFMILGFLRGILGIVFGVASWVFVFIFVNWASPVILDNIREGAIQEKVFEATYDYLDKKVDDDISGAIPGMEDESDVRVDKIQEDLFSVYGIKLPKELLTDDENSIDITDMMDKSVIKKAADDARTMILMQVTAVVTLAILRALSSIIAVVVALLICTAVFILIKLISKTPFLGEANRKVGLVFGAVEGLMVVWILMYVIAVAGTSDFGQKMMAQIDGNFILGFLYEYNLFLVNGIA